MAKKGTWGRTIAKQKLITSRYNGSPIAGQRTVFPEYNEGNGKRQKPKALLHVSQCGEYR
jgi:hypothetical protein